MEVLPGPDRENEEGREEADGDADGDGGEPLVRELQELVHAVARHSHHGEGQYENHHAVVVPRLQLRDEPRERRCRPCTSRNSTQYETLIWQFSKHTQVMANSGIDGVVLRVARMKHLADLYPSCTETFGKKRIVGHIIFTLIIYYLLNVL